MTCRELLKWGNKAYNYLRNNNCIYLAEDATEDINKDQTEDSFDSMVDDERDSDTDDDTDHENSGDDLIQGAYHYLNNFLEKIHSIFISRKNGLNNDKEQFCNGRYRNLFTQFI
jgi:hypothetical protein